MLSPAMYSTAKRILVGKPIPSADEHHQRLRKFIALPVFASDAISSTAYATDEILVVLLIQAQIGKEAWKYLVPIALIVCVLLTIVALSYRQTIFAYPSGGGSYIVSRENLGTIPSLIAGSSLLIDYTMTVAVSVAGGVLAIRSAAGFDERWTVPVCLLCVLLMTVANLRGLKESGGLFAGPTYFYIIMLVLLIVTGLIRIFIFDLGPIPNVTVEGRALARMNQSLSFIMLLRAFSSGAVAALGRGGDLQRRARLPEAGVAQRGPDADRHGHHPRHDLPRRVDPRRPPAAVPGRAGPDRHRPDGRVDLQRQGRPVLDDAGGHLRHPDPRRQHGLRRLPPALVDHRAGRVPAPPVRQPRRPAWCSPTGSSSWP